MNIKAELIALGLRVLADRGIIAKPDPFGDLFQSFMTGKTAEQRLAEDIANVADKAVAGVKRANTDRKFKKITKNV